MNKILHLFKTSWMTGAVLFVVMCGVYPLPSKYKEKGVILMEVKRCVKIFIHTLLTALHAFSLVVEIAELVE